jgi:signal peptidase I
MELKPTLKKIWHFLWEEDSIWSWLANIVIAFILIKFIVYPVLGAVLGTGFPVVAVVSGSMEHEGSFDDWWSSGAVCPHTCTQGEWYEKMDISKEAFLTYDFKNGFNKGDIMVLKGVKPENIKKGDVIVFSKQFNKEPIIHRVIEDKEDTFQTKGDHNKDVGRIDKGITEDELVGKAVFKIPFLGWVKILFVELLQIIGIV